MIPAGASDEELLVLADALVEKGDPRGEFIALQIRNKALHRQRELLATHEDDWLGPLARVIAKPHRVWERGSLTSCIVEMQHLTEAHITDPRWAHARELVFSSSWAWAEIAGLILREAPLGRLRALYGVREPAFDALRSRSLETIGVRSAFFDWARLEVFPALRALAVHEWFSPQSLERFARSAVWERVERLQALRGVDLAQWVRVLRERPPPRLEELHLVDSGDWPHRPVRWRVVLRGDELEVAGLDAKPDRATIRQVLRLLDEVPDGSFARVRAPESIVRATRRLVQGWRQP